MTSEVDLDVLIVGAGLSGIAAAYYVQKLLPDARYAILEAREALSGTWDLFRYPGIRSDSDMNTLGFSFRSWAKDRTIASGADIRAYIADTARAFGIDQHIRFKRRVTAADWDSVEAVWTVTVDHDDGVRTLRCRFLYMCTGYYDYSRGHQPIWPGVEGYRGRLVHPQAWPDDLDYRGKRVVVIGSGATAVTLAPTMAQTAEHVTVLQRSPTYVASRPAVDPFSKTVKRWLPRRLAQSVVRWKNILLGIVIFRMARARPEKMKQRLADLTRAALGPDYDMRHFTPRYDPWDQRLCLVPDGDLFEAIRAGRVEMVTDQIAAFDETGIVLASGQRLEADIVVSATGLKLELMGKAALSIDGAPTRLTDHLSYKGMMFSEIPNFAYAFGYTNASWTLKCELTAAYVCRLIGRMTREGWDWCVPKVRDDVGSEEALDFSSGYIQRGADELPRQGDRAPWKLHQNYVLDLVDMKFGRLDDGAMTFGRRSSTTQKAAA